MSSDEIPFFVPWITEEDKRAVLEALQSRWLTGGPRAAIFEKTFADYVGTKHAISVNSCTAALHVAMRVLDLKPGDEVVVPVLTFAATANAPIFCGAKPVFADIDEKTFNISTEDVSNRITDKTRAIIAVHYGGQACNMKQVLEIAEDHGLVIVEDCAHSLGSEYNGKKTGNLGTIGCFSFYPTKIITTLEGGMITTDDGKLAERSKLLREHGMTKSAIDRESHASWFYDIVDLGYNYRLNEVQAALGMSQLGRLEEGINRRIEIAHYFSEELNRHVGAGITPPYETAQGRHIFHLYTIKVNKDQLGITRDDLFKRLSASKIGLSVHYTPLHLMSYYKQFLEDKTKFPVAEKVYSEILSMPLYPTMKREEIDFVVSRIEEAAKS